MTGNTHTLTGGGNSITGLVASNLEVYTYYDAMIGKCFINFSFTGEQRSRADPVVVLIYFRETFMCELIYKLQ